MQERMVNGRRCTNRPGAAEYLGRSLQTINLVASPKRRSSTGWPACVGVEDGRQWYAFDDLDAFRVSYLETKQRDRRARVYEVAFAGDTGRDGYLPRPDREEPARHGVVRYWKRHRAESWINSRRGSASSPGRPKKGGPGSQT